MQNPCPPAPDALLAPHPADSELDDDDRRALSAVRAEVPGWIRLADRVPPSELVDCIVAGTAYGPVGIQCSDIVTTLEHALAAGGRKTMDITEVAPGVKVCLLFSPQGHEIELVQAG